MFVVITFLFQINTSSMCSTTQRTLKSPYLHPILHYCTCFHLTCLSAIFVVSVNCEQHVLCLLHPSSRYFTDFVHKIRGLIETIVSIKSEPQASLPSSPTLPILFVFLSPSPLPFPFNKSELVGIIDNITHTTHKLTHTHTHVANKDPKLGAFEDDLKKYSL